MRARHLVDRRFSVRNNSDPTMQYACVLQITHMRLCKPLCKSAQMRYKLALATKQTVCDCVLYALRIADVN